MRLIDQLVAHPDVVKPPNSRGEATAWCPWHPDKEGGKPSLGINNKKSPPTIKCWSCGKGGIRNLARAWGIIETAADAVGQEIERTFDYHSEDGGIIFQVVRFKVPKGADKKIVQRRPDPSRTGEWIWNLKNVRPVLYRLPDLAAAAVDEWVYLVEGEPDAERLRDAGLVATTNPGGAGKWKGYFNKALRGRRVVILPDNDAAGRNHAALVAAAIADVVAELKVLELPGLSPKGDVSDWMELGNGNSAEALATLVMNAAHYEPPPAESNGSGPDMFWDPSKWQGVALEIIARLKEHGYFISGEDRAYYFNAETRVLAELDSMEMASLLNQRYGVNQAETLSSFLSKQMAVECFVRGRKTIVRQFAYYDHSKNLCYLDTHDGRMLRCNGDVSPETLDNGEDGVLFAPVYFAEPWTYLPEVKGNAIWDLLIEPLNFSTDEASFFEPDEQRILLLLWLLSTAFESIQPTKPLALAVGPAGAGKTLLFRRIGKLLFGPEYQVDALRKDKEDEYWTAVTTRPFATFDNVDRWIGWLNDALAQSATGVQVTKRQLYTTNQAVKFVSRCMISLTAMTPMSMRREDVATRLLIFHLDRLDDKKPEFELLNAIEARRNELMSDFANMVNLTVHAKPVGSPEPSIRLADFARVAMRIGMGLGWGRQVADILKRLPASQMGYAAEDDPLILALEHWVLEAPPRKAQSELAGMQLTTNAGRPMGMSDLQDELKAIADDHALKWPYRSHVSLGQQFRNKQELIETRFTVERDRIGKAGARTIRISPKPTQAELPSENS